jgi:hypothetical protein
MTNIIPITTITKASIRRQAAAEVKQLEETYRITAAFQDPEPPCEELREHFERGEVEL